jgi:hypothetical protein
VHIFVGVGGYVGSAPAMLAKSPAYLGTGERAPRPSFRPAFEPVMNDLTGSRIPYDWMFEGEEAIVTVRLTRWDEPTLAALQNRTGPAGQPRGVNFANDVGTLMLTEGAAYPLWLLFPFGIPGIGKPAMIAGGLPQGYHFYAAFLEGPDDRDSLGTNPATVDLTWHCGRVFSSSGANNIPRLGTVLFDHDMSAVNTMNLVA